MGLKTTTLDTLYDLCIIGSGPAGLTLCAELAESGKKICILESGEKNKTQTADVLREVESSGEIKIKQSSRERIWGGTSTTWAGLSSPLDDIDFIDRVHLSHPVHWPLNATDLTPYYQKASRYGFPAPERFNSIETTHLRDTSELKIPHDFLQEKIFIAADPPWNFGKELNSKLKKENVDIFLDATVINLSSESGPSGTQVTEAIIKHKDGSEQKIKARNFIIAAGGIESVRLLLLSNDTNSKGLGNEYDQVGKYIMNHPKGNHGLLHLNKPVKKLPYFFGYLQNGWAEYAGIRLNEATQLHLGVLNSYIRFEPIFPWTDNSGVQSLVILTKQMKFFLDWWKKKQKHLIHLRDYNETGDDIKITSRKEKFNLFFSLYKILIDFPVVINYLIHRLFQNKELPIKTIRLRNFMDMEPRPENRITLSKELDRNGQRLPVVTLSTSSLDRRSVIELHRIFGEEMKKNNIGVLESSLDEEGSWPISQEASHHLGGTRMGDDPKNSVVNKNLQVHSVHNLYICSVSVFPTAGSANPTYTLCALAIRLANHLK